MRINDVLKGKQSADGDAVVTITPDASVRELLALLARHNVGALIVSVDGSSVDGIVSERDVVRKLHTGDAILDGPVSAIMTTQVLSCEPDATVDSLMVLMTEHRIRHVPVVTAGRLTGIISIGDVVKSRMAELEFERDQLDSYVHQS
ncbi:CBS domain-containing protein [Nocardioides bigeumensis]|uniref:CBS domain-containing protein n=1 Tax=Nocardioides bigeumensis TaxID=433657 RepID=A0ABP5JXZ7_9ACTN